MEGFLFYCDRRRQDANLGVLTPRRAHIGGGTGGHLHFPLEARPASAMHGCATSTEARLSRSPRAGQMSLLRGVNSHVGDPVRAKAQRSRRRDRFRRRAAGTALTRKRRRPVLSRATFTVRDEQSRTEADAGFPVLPLRLRQPQSGKADLRHRGRFVCAVWRVLGFRAWWTKEARSGGY